MSEHRVSGGLEESQGQGGADEYVTLSSPQGGSATVVKSRFLSYTLKYLGTPKYLGYTTTNRRIGQWQNNKMVAQPWV